MDGKKVTIVGIIALLIGLLIGYLFWGYQTRQFQGELASAKARLAPQCGRARWRPRSSRSKRSSRRRQSD